MNLEDLENSEPWQWPENTPEVLLAMLNDNDAPPSERLLAAGFAGDYTVINDDIGAALLAIVSNAAEPEELRARAAISFGAALEGADTFEFDDPDDVPISETMFHRVQDALRSLYGDAGVPKIVRRRILEASVRAPQEWHAGAIAAAWASGDDEWKLTAVFAMAHVRGFDAEILEALESEDPDIFFEAITAAGAWEVDAAWLHVVEVLEDDETDKELLIAAIEAAASIRPAQAAPLLADLLDSDDEEIVEAAQTALVTSGAFPELDDEDLDGDDLDDEPRH